MSQNCSRELEFKIDEYKINISKDKDKDLPLSKFFLKLFEELKKNYINQREINQEKSKEKEKEKEKKENSYLDDGHSNFRNLSINKLKREYIKEKIILLIY
jgi:hypothetical protein